MGDNGFGATARCCCLRSRLGVTKPAVVVNRKNQKFWLRDEEKIFLFTTTSLLPKRIYRRSLSRAARQFWFSSDQLRNSATIVPEVSSETASFHPTRPVRREWIRSLLKLLSVMSGK